VEEQANIREELFNKLFNRYSFNLDGDNDQGIHMKKRWRNMENSKKNENTRLL
jgi:hypothetical protein